MCKRSESSWMCVDSIRDLNAYFTMRWNLKFNRELVKLTSKTECTEHSEMTHKLNLQNATLYNFSLFFRSQQRGSRFISFCMTCCQFRFIRSLLYVFSVSITLYMYEPPNSTQTINTRAASRHTMSSCSFRNVL